MSKLVLITGGARSGKSTYAESLAQHHSKVAYIATCQCYDEEMSERISAHKERRPAHWQLIEEPLHIVTALEKVPPDSLVLVECLGLWVSNWLLANENMEDKLFFSLMQENLSHLRKGLQSRPGDSIIVTNEVGMGVVPPYRLGRVFRDTLGWVNQDMARSASDVCLCAVGLPLYLKRNGVMTNG